MYILMAMATYAIHIHEENFIHNYQVKDIK